MNCFYHIKTYLIIVLNFKKGGFERLKIHTCTRLLNNQLFKYKQNKIIQISSPKSVNEIMLKDNDHLKYFYVYCIIYLFFFNLRMYNIIVESILDLQWL